MSLHVIRHGSSSKRTCVPQHQNQISGFHPELFYLSASSKTITFYNKDTRGEIQKATFNQEQVKRVFHGSFHKVRASCVCLMMM